MITSDITTTPAQEEVSASMSRWLMLAGSVIQDAYAARNILYDLAKTKNIGKVPFAYYVTHSGERVVSLRRNHVRPLVEAEAALARHIHAVLPGRVIRIDRSSVMAASWAAMYPSLLFGMRFPVSSRVVLIAYCPAQTSGNAVSHRLYDHLDAAIVPIARRQGPVPSGADLLDTRHWWPAYGHPAEPAGILLDRLNAAEEHVLRHYNSSDTSIDNDYEF